MSNEKGNKPKHAYVGGQDVAQHDVGAPPKPVAGGVPLQGNQYQKINRGYPVKEGQTWSDLTPDQRKQWFHEHENRWKGKYNRDMASAMGAGANMDWTRG